MVDTLECWLSLHGISWEQELKSSFDLEAYEYLWGASLLMLGLQPQCDLRQVSCFGNLWDWDWTTIMNRNEHVKICLLANIIHSNVTPSYALMWSDRRGLWWICNEFKPLSAYTKMVVSLCFSFEDFSQVFPMRVLRALYWMSAQWWWIFI
jgi:hypothetical protein